jgi:hypothetical protein
MSARAYWWWALLIVAPGCASAPPQTATPLTASGTTVSRVVREPIMVRPMQVHVKRVKILIPAIDGPSTCRVLTGVPQPGVASVLVLSFPPNAEGGRSVAVGLAPDGSVVNYSDIRGDLAAGPDGQRKPGARMTSINVNPVERRAFVTNERGGKSDAYIARGKEVLTAPNLDNPQAMIDRIYRECASVAPQAVAPSTGGGRVEQARVSALKAGQGSNNPEDFTPAFPATDSGGACVNMPALPIPGVAKSLHLRFRVNGVLVRDVSLAMDSAGAPLIYQDNRSANLQNPAGPMGSASTSIFLDFRAGTAQLSNMSAKGGLQLANVRLRDALDAQSLGVPSAMIARLRAECEKR